MKAGLTRYIELDEVAKVLRNCVMETFEDEEGRLKVESLQDGKPVKLSKLWGSQFMLVYGK